MMTLPLPVRRFELAALAVVLCSPLMAFSAQRQVVTPVDETQRVVLNGNIRPEANAKHDLGPVDDSLPLEHMQLLLHRADDTQRALDAYTESLSEKGSPNYHHWLSAAEFGARFGLAQEDIDAVTGWLKLHGLTVGTVYPDRVTIDFSGTAAQVREAFLTEIHAYDVKGVRHIANSSNPQIPAALAGAVTGIVSLNDFRPHPMYKPRAQYTFSSGGNTVEAVTPADLAKIYNLAPLFKAGYTGKGQTIVVIEDTNVYSTQNWSTFRKTFGLSGYTNGSFTQVHPAPKSGSNNCANPGVNDNDGEAILDAEYASAAAPNAAIVLASCADTNTTFGGQIALQNLLNDSKTPPALVSISYGECEEYNGASYNKAFSNLYQQAVTEGVSIFVSSGDEDAASCDVQSAAATHGITVSGFASTPYNVAVGGTDFEDTFLSENSTYWNSSNTSAFESAKSYIPEIPWNDSCASSLLAKFETGSTVAYGTKGFCNTSLGETDFLGVAGGSGGPSACATGSPSTSGVDSGSCKGWPKPSWQSVVGNPHDGVRDIPDVSLFAANGLWGHYYPYCDGDSSRGASCSGAPDAWSGAGGTSFASPIFAGIQALVDQKWGRQGNPNPVYYKIAKAEYGSGGNSSCNSSLGNGIKSTCAFHDITAGDMDVNCTGTHNCYRPSGTNGVLSLSDSSYQPTYRSTTGWDFATGLGTVNAYNLVLNSAW